LVVYHFLTTPITEPDNRKRSGNTIKQAYDNRSLFLKTVGIDWIIQKHPGSTSLGMYKRIGIAHHIQLKKEKLFIEFLDNLTVFSIDNGVIDIASNIYSNLRKNGKSIGDADILIAAIVIKNDGTLVSNNTKHFIDINQLKLINWI
jgi:tRNA(fMet)-specific endonuclease VapC